MGRSLRIIPAGYPVHVVHRGNNRMAIFHVDNDCHFFRHCLSEGGVGEGVDLHSYVLMPNHVHLLLTAHEDTGVSKLIQSAARRYVGYYNAKYGRTGTLWEGRFHSSIVTTDYYLLACHRYIDMNPVRSGLANYAADYRWSTHRHYSHGIRDEMVTGHSTIEDLAREDGRRREAYRLLFDAGLSPADLEVIRGALRRGRPLGDGRVYRPRGRPRKMVSDTIFQAGQGTARRCEEG